MPSTDRVGTRRVDERFRLRHDCTVAFDNGRLVLSCAGRNFAISPLSPPLAPAIEALAAAALDRTAIAELVTDDVAAAQLGPLLERLLTRGWLERTLLVDGVPLATLRPTALLAAASSPTGSALPAAGSRIALSRFACLRRAGSDAIVESPRSPAVVVLHDDRLGALIAALASAGEPNYNFGLPADAIARVLELLSGAGLTSRLDDPADEDGTRSLAQWSFPDLLFHARSRFGRHQNGYGATWPLKGRFESPPRRKNPSGTAIPLHRPDMAKVRSSDPPFSAVLDGRRSVREHDDAAPITLSQLDEFLFRVARVRTPPDVPSGAGDRPYGSARPYPTGGARYELEMYPIVGSCDGLDPGLYHYDPFEHRLHPIDDPVNRCRLLLQDGQRRSLMGKPPQVLIALTARFGRVMYKYESMAYATTLKNVGVLYQTMYCVATAMGLAPCALGGGSSDLLAEAVGIDYYEESGVGEFLLGSAPLQ